MSQERTRRPARKRQPEERLPETQVPTPALDEPVHDVKSNPVATHDPHGWLAIMLMVMATSIVAVIAILIWSAV